MNEYILSAQESCRYYDQARFSALSLKPKIVKHDFLEIFPDMIIYNPPEDLFDDH